MFERILKSLAKLFSSPTTQSSLEAYIVAGNPQDMKDIDRLERKFFETNRRQTTMFFHE